VLNSTFLFQFLKTLMLNSTSLLELREVSTSLRTLGWEGGATKSNVLEHLLLKAPCA